MYNVKHLILFYLFVGEISHWEKLHMEDACRRFKRKYLEKTNLMKHKICEY